MHLLNNVEIFVAVAEEGSFSSAARRLGLPTSTVSRRISDLEMQVGARLLNRTTRRVSLSVAGEVYLAGAKDVIFRLSEVEKAVREVTNELSGNLTIAAPIPAGRRLLSGVSSEFHKEFENIKIRLVLNNPVEDFENSGVDLALKIDPQGDSDHLSTGLGSFKVVFFCSESYLLEYGCPQRPAELKDHRIAAYTPFDHRARWQFSENEGTTSQLDISPVFQANDVSSVVNYVASGQAIGWLHSYQIEEQLRSGSLKIILRDFELPARELRFVYPGGGNIPSRLRSYLEFSAPRIRQRLAQVNEFLDKSTN